MRAVALFFAASAFCAGFGLSQAVSPALSDWLETASAAPGEAAAAHLTLVNDGKRQESVRLEARVTGEGGGRLLTQRLVLLPGESRDVEIPLNGRAVTVALTGAAGGINLLLDGDGCTPRWRIEVVQGRLSGQDLGCDGA